MNGSPFRGLNYSTPDWITPARKTTPHHCWAERKDNQFIGRQPAIGDVTRKLFGSSEARTGDQIVQAKLFR